MKSPCYLGYLRRHAMQLLTLEMVSVVRLVPGSIKMAMNHFIQQVTFFTRLSQGLIESAAHNTILLIVMSLTIAYSVKIRYMNSGVCSCLICLSVTQTGIKITGATYSRLCNSAKAWPVVVEINLMSNGVLRRGLITE